jgi:hypothetical protein
MTRLPGLEKLHHADVISLALTRLARDFTGRGHDEVVRELKSGKDKRFGLPTPSTAANLRVPPPEKKEPPANSQKN